MCDDRPYKVWMYLHVRAYIMILRQVNCVEIYNKIVQCKQSMQQAWVTGNEPNVLAHF